MPRHRRGGCAAGAVAAEAAALGGCVNRGPVAGGRLDEVLCGDDDGSGGTTPAVHAPSTVARAPRRRHCYVVWLSAFWCLHDRPCYGGGGAVHRTADAVVWHRLRRFVEGCDASAGSPLCRRPTATSAGGLGADAFGGGGPLAWQRWRGRRCAGCRRRRAVGGRVVVSDAGCIHCLAGTGWVHSRGRLHRVAGAGGLRSRRGRLRCGAGSGWLHEFGIGRELRDHGAAVRWAAGWPLDADADAPRGRRLYAARAAEKLAHMRGR
mmetsp:Transcript_163172/g.523307  ORF Transcript_163172/g.523307 Transcript_163172/m.523307 type:complete len:264 (+) Transcript_163172:753-1544(+)